MAGEPLSREHWQNTLDNANAEERHEMEHDDQQLFLPPRDRWQREDEEEERDAQRRTYAKRARSPQPYNNGTNLPPFKRFIDNTTRPGARQPNGRDNAHLWPPEHVTDAQIEREWQSFFNEMVPQRERDRMEREMAEIEAARLRSRARQLQEIKERFKESRKRK